MSIWKAARAGDVGEVERLLGHDPGLVNAVRRAGGRTPLICASEEGHVGLVRWLLDKGAAIDQQHAVGGTAMRFACSHGRLPVVRLLLERGADPTIATRGGSTPLGAAAFGGHLEVVRVLLGHPSAKATVNHRADYGVTVLWLVCFIGRGEIVRALLERGADPTIANDHGITPMAATKEPHPNPIISAEGRRECEAALKVRSCLALSSQVLFFVSLSTCSSDQLSEARVAVVGRDCRMPSGPTCLEGPAGGRPAGERRGGGGGCGG
jgi:hypothetical protein